MRNLVCVRADGGGWLLESELPGFPRSFSSGARAEEAAVRYAQEQAEQGQPTEVRLFLRDGSLAARFLVCGPDRRLALAS